MIRRNRMAGRLCSGTVAGVAASLLMQGMQRAGERLAPEQMPPIREDPGKYMVEKAQALLPGTAAAQIPQGMKQAITLALGVGYGTTFTVLYALARRKVKNVPLDGSVLGLAAWGTGYLGWLTATGLMPPVTKQKPVQVLGAVASHIVFGIAAVEMYRALRRR